MDILDGNRAHRPASGYSLMMMMMMMMMIDIMKNKKQKPVLQCHDVCHNYT